MSYLQMPVYARVSVSAYETELFLLFALENETFLRERKQTKFDVSDRRLSGFRTNK